MNKYFFRGLILLLMVHCPIYGAEKSFTEDLSSLRKNIIGMCAQLQAGQPKESQEKLLAEVDGIMAGWDTITEKYKNNPPSEFANDPAWSRYFTEARDNFQIMRGKIENRNYKRAAKFCGLNCALFTAIYEVNGIEKFTNKMFHVRKQLKTVISYASAKNWSDAEKLTINAGKQVDLILESTPPAGADKDEHTVMMKNLSEAMKEFNAGVKSRDIKILKEKFNILLKIFGKIYRRYI